MENTTYTFLPRLNHLIRNRELQDVPLSRFVFYISGWLITFLFLINALEIGSFTWIQIWLFSLGIFWYRLNRDILSRITVPIELMLVILFVLLGLQYLYWESLLIQIRQSSVTEFHLGLFNGFLQALIILIIGWILISNPESPRRDNKPVRQGVLIPLILIGYAGHLIVFFEHEYYLYLLQLLLLLFLINHTSWLERLSRKDLWLYFWIILVVFIIFREPGGIQEIKLATVDQKLTWFSIPLYFFLVFKIYVLAVLIRIPIVLIYNHARLSGKLWIAGLFQSTFPQIIQFVFLVLIFYFFVSSWQAQEMRRTITEFFNNPELSQQTDLFLLREKGIPGYKPVPLGGADPPQGIVLLSTLHNENHYFLYSRVADDPERISLIRIDTLFCNTLSKKLTLLAGNGVMMYPFNPKPWQSFLYERDFVEKQNQVKIYPFDFTTNNRHWSISSSIENLDSDETRIIVFGSDINSFRQKFIVGRLLYPVLATTDFGNSLFAVDIIMSMRFSFFSSSMANVVLFLIVLFLVVNLFIIRRVGRFGSHINKIIIHKFDQLKTGIRAISSGNLDYRLKMEGEDEFVELADHFNRMGDRLQQTIAEAREKDRLDHELQIARQVQLSLLPGSLPVVKGYEIAASMKTANEVGGDFYDLIALDKNLYLFTIGDVSGKGSSAAFYMAQFLSLLRFSPQFTREPAELAQRLNDYFSNQLVDRQVFVTAIIGVLNVATHRLQFVRAGHTFPFLIPGDAQKAIQEIRTEGIGIGLTKSEKMFGKKLELKEIVFEPGDSFILYTDGVVEAAKDIGPETEIFGENRFKKILEKSRRESGKKIMAQINSEIDLFYGKEPRVDDHTLIILNRIK